MVLKRVFSDGLWSFISTQYKNSVINSAQLLIGTSMYYFYRKSIKIYDMTFPRTSVAFKCYAREHRSVKQDVTSVINNSYVFFHTL